MKKAFLSCWTNFTDENNLLHIIFPTRSRIRTYANAYTLSQNFEGVTPFLQGLIEPPDAENIRRSYHHLFEHSLISAPNDKEGYLTPMGQFVGALPVDISLGQLVAMGVMLGVGAEAVVLAAALSLPRSVFRFANRMRCSPSEYHSIIRQKFLTALEFDAGTYSEPIMLLRLLCKWRQLSRGSQGSKDAESASKTTPANLPKRRRNKANSGGSSSNCKAENTDTTAASADAVTAESLPRSSTYSLDNGHTGSAFAWAHRHAIVPAVMRQFKSIADSLARSVSKCLVSSQRSSADIDPRPYTSADINSRSYNARRRRRTGQSEKVDPAPGYEAVDQYDVTGADGGGRASSSSVRDGSTLDAATGGGTRSGPSIIDLDRISNPSPSTVNLLRLILLWTSSGNILQQKAGRNLAAKIVPPPSMLSVTTAVGAGAAMARSDAAAAGCVADLPIPKHCEVTAAHFEALLGPSESADVLRSTTGNRQSSSRRRTVWFPHSVELRRKVVYDGRLEGWDARDPYFSLALLVRRVHSLAREVHAGCLFVEIQGSGGASAAAASFIGDDTSASAPAPMGAGGANSGRSRRNNNNHENTARSATGNITGGGDIPGSREGLAPDGKGSVLVVIAERVFEETLQALRTLVFTSEARQQELEEALHSLKAHGPPQSNVAAADEASTFNSGSGSDSGSVSGSRADLGGNRAEPISDHFDDPCRDGPSPLIAQRLEGFRIAYWATRISKPEHRRLNDFRKAYDYGMLSMMLPLTGAAKLSVCNCTPSEEAVRAIFSPPQRQSSPSEPVLRMSADFDDHSSALDLPLHLHQQQRHHQQAHIKAHISRQVVDESMVLRFPTWSAASLQPPTQRTSAPVAAVRSYEQESETQQGTTRDLNDCHGVKDGQIEEDKQEEANKDKKKKKKMEREEEEKMENRKEEVFLSSTQPFIQDLPLGHRLLKCCRQKLGKTFKDNPLVFERRVVRATGGGSGASSRKDTDTGNGPASGSRAGKEPVPGSAEFFEQKRLEHERNHRGGGGGGGGGGSGEGNEEDEDAGEGAGEDLHVVLPFAEAQWVNLAHIKTTPDLLQSYDEEMSAEDIYSNEFPLTVPTSLRTGTTALTRQGQGKGQGEGQRVGAGSDLHREALQAPRGVNVTCFTDSQSMLGASMHTGPEPLFAIASSILLLGKKTNQQGQGQGRYSAQLGRCDGLTLLPPGALWLFLALLCARADVSHLSPWQGEIRSALEELGDLAGTGSGGSAGPEAFLMAADRVHALLFEEMAACAWGATDGDSPRGSTWALGGREGGVKGPPGAGSNPGRSRVATAAASSRGVRSSTETAILAPRPEAVAAINELFSAFLL